MTYKNELRQLTTDKIALAFPALKGNVFNSRQVVVRRDLTPCVRIYTDNEVDEKISMSIQEYRATMDLVVQVIVEGNADPETADVADTLCEEIQTCLLTDPEWLKKAYDIHSIRVDSDLNADGNKRTATGNLIFNIGHRYWYDDTTIDDFLTMVVKLDAIDPPADPNTGPPGTPPNVDGGYHGGRPGPDGRVEVHARWNLQGHRAEGTSEMQIKTPAPVKPKTKQPIEPDDTAASFKPEIMAETPVAAAKPKPAHKRHGHGRREP